MLVPNEGILNVGVYDSTERLKMLVQMLVWDQISIRTLEKRL